MMADAAGFEGGAVVAPGVGSVVCLCYLAGRPPESAVEELRADGLGEYDADAVRELYREVGEFLARLDQGRKEYQRLRDQGAV